MKLHHNGNSEGVISRYLRIHGTASVDSWDSGKVPSTVTLSALLGEKILAAGKAGGGPTERRIEPITAKPEPFRFLWELMGRKWDFSGWDRSARNDEGSTSWDHDFQITVLQQPIMLFVVHHSLTPRKITVIKLHKY